jgi:hypothetical protein
MGITLGKLQQLRDMRALPVTGKILDLGSSNLYSADSVSLTQFAASFGRELDAGTIQRLADGSTYGSGITKNASFVGGLFEGLGFEYLALDIANGYRTQIFDLNVEKLPRRLRSNFDIVLNFGTTEHVINQLNAFRVIHDAVKVGGHIVHQLPTAGYIYHGYFCYTPRFFFDLAGYNQYEVVDFSYDGPGPASDMFGIIRDYASQYPVLTKHLNQDARLIQDYSLSVVLRKTRNERLRLPMEKSTSVFVTEPVKRAREWGKRLLGSFAHS